MYVCVCVCVCVRARERERESVCVCVCRTCNYQKVIPSIISMHINFNVKYVCIHQEYKFN